MLRKLSRRLTYANVMSSVAVFGVLAGGTAYAANTIRSGDIVDNEVTTTDVRDDTLGFGGLLAQDLAAGSVRSSEVQDNSLTGADVNESSLNLPQTPTAATFEGRGNVSLDNNDGNTAIVTRSLPAGSYAIAATANISTNDARAEASYDTACELRNHTGAFIGGARDRRFRPGAAASTISLSMNGGVTIPAGGGTVGVYCRYVDGTTFSNTLGDAQMMIIRLDGFF